jgi:hypothetical protein
MTSLGSSSISYANQILQPNFAGGANPSGAHFVNPGPQFSSIVGGVTGCGGAGGSAAALAGNPGYNFVAKQSGGKTHRRGGYKRGKINKSNKRNKRGCTCRARCHCRRQNKKRSCRCRGRCHCRKSNKRQRGGLGAFSPASFSGANPPYHQYMGNTLASNNFSVGAESLSPAMSGMANPGPITVFPNCAAQ